MLNALKNICLNDSEAVRGTPHVLKWNKIYHLPSKTVSERTMIIPGVVKVGFSLTYEAINSGFLWFYKST